MSDDLMPDPKVWAQCSECGAAYALRRMMKMSGERVWLWSIDCKHKKAEAIPANADGPVDAPMVQT